MPKPKNVRKRDLPGPTLRGKYRYYSIPPTRPAWEDPPTHASWDFKGTQLTVSEGHHWPPPKGADLNDRGGDFMTTKSWVQMSDKSETLRRTLSGAEQLYTGQIPCCDPRAYGPLFPTNIASSDSKLDQLGATAIARCKPTNPPADLSTFLGELLKEGLPSLIGSSVWKPKTNSARKKAADEYLNVQFGWVPVLSEMRKFANVAERAALILAQYERDAGRVVRRKYRFPTEKTTSETVLATNTTSVVLTGGNQWFSPPYGTLVRKREITRDVWFSGAFTYHLPSGYDSRNRLERIASDAKILFGADITPETIWNLTPWSWAVDWFANAGDVISNLGDFATGGTVMRYGYVMEHTITRDTYTISNSGLIKPSAGRAPIVSITETKKRRAANPYGFGVSWDGLSTFQASILAALGISRSSR